MNEYPYRAFVNKNPNFHIQNRERLNSYYSSVQRMLLSWSKHIPRDSCGNQLYQMLYEPFAPSQSDREARLESNIKLLGRLISCKPGRYCSKLAFCPECLSLWRYGIAKTIQKAHQINPKIRLICRQETILMPRGVFKERYDNELHLMTNYRINPVYELPVGTKWSPYSVWKIMENDNVWDYHNDDQLSDYYELGTLKVWNAIAGPDIVENPVQFNRDKTRTESERAEYMHIREEIARKRKNNIKKGISNLVENTLLVELQARMTWLNNLTKDCMGSVQRLSMFPSILNDSTILLRLDSLFLSTQDYYQYIKQDDEFQNHKRFQNIDWPGPPRGIPKWHPRQKVVVAYKTIPDNVMDILKIVESRFSCSCNLYPRLLVNEFPLFMNCFADRKMIRTAGFFREE